MNFNLFALYVDNIGIGAIAGVMLMTLICGTIFSKKRKQYIMCTGYCLCIPLVIAMILLIANSPRIQGTPLFVGVLIGAYLGWHIITWMEKFTQALFKKDEQKPPK